MKKRDPGRKVLVTNRRAFHEYEVLERFEAGVVLRGTEVKSIRAGQISLQEAYARCRDGELFLVEAHVKPYENCSFGNHDPVRARKLLLHRRELRHIAEALERRGLTVIPLDVYLRDGLIKLTLGLCRGKKLHDKRDTLRKDAVRRDIDRELSGRS